MPIVTPTSEDGLSLSPALTRFTGGMDLNLNELYLGTDTYPLAFNVRHRSGALSLVNRPVTDAGVPSGTMQNLYAFRDLLLLFQFGKAYYRYQDSATWTRFYNLDMSAAAEHIYCAEVPASRFNFKRTLADADNVYSTPAQLATLTSQITINGSLAGIVVQDGLSRPKLLLPDLTVRFLSDYADWTTTVREYVPIAKQMLYHNKSGKLFMVSPDGKQFWGSVSGRPLDFVVNITQPGDKGGDVSSFFYNVSDEVITGIHELDTGDILVTTMNNMHIVSLNYDNTRFGEPELTVPRRIPTGVINQFSFAEGLNDFYLTDIEGPKKLSEVASMKNEARASDFSLNIAPAITSENPQDSTFACCVNFNDYIMFQLKTIYGNVIAVFDTKTDKWVSFDSVGYTVKQFALLSQETFPELWAITTTGELIQLDAARVVNGGWLYSDEYPMEWESGEALMGILYTPHICMQSNDDLLVHNVQFTLDKVTEDGEASVYQITDNVKKSGFLFPLVTTNGGWTFEDEYPMEWRSLSTVKNLVAPFERIADRGYKHGALIQWNSGELVRAGFDATIQTNAVPSSQKCIPIEVSIPELTDIPVVTDTFVPVGPGPVIPPPVSVHDPLNFSAAAVSSSGATTSLSQSINLTFPADKTDLCLVVGLYVMNAGAAVVPTLQFNGVDLFLKDEQAYDGSNNKIAIYYLQNPPMGTHALTLSITGSSSAIAYMTAYTLYGVDQLSPLNAPQVNAGFVTTLTATEICLNDRSYLIGVAGQYGAPIGTAVGPVADSPSTGDSQFGTATGAYGGSVGHSQLYLLGETMSYSVTNQVTFPSGTATRSTKLLTVQINSAS